ncbi:MAG: hypothetical protein ACRD3S_08290, partial [Terracidiphilus sp.]
MATRKAQGRRPRVTGKPHCAEATRLQAPNLVLEHAVLELAVMANVLNPETESTTLNTELETPVLEPASELEQPSHESTSNPAPSATQEDTPLDADAYNQTAAKADLREASTAHA